MKLNRVIISGGGTGGHIFPAVAIADEIKRRNPDAAILFIGAKGKMEMEKVPQAGYQIVGLPIAGFQRRLTFSNFILPFKLVWSLLLAAKVIRGFKPQLVIGVGGYASGPTLQMAQLLGYATLIQEQNSYPGKTNQLLAKRCQKICVAYEHMERFFPADKVVLTGNPVRSFVQLKEANLRQEAAAFFGLDSSKKTILVIGGSLGARTLNSSMANGYKQLAQAGYQLLWQCGKSYEPNIAEFGELPAEIKVTAFIQRMDYAYALADVIVSRAGAISVSELALVSKPVILVPSPNVAEDHQTKNAMALVEKGAALLVRDTEAPELLVKQVLELATNPSAQSELASALVRFAKPTACAQIVDTCEQLIVRV
ncbi:MAG: hypothetical protein RLZZ301_1698 [Bacteroidota bacterium]|jgi:UDP-N-acetylglucosamine--N-acetylmuramyl-(pentapeptide) pyrophosphoryl-undecaprenol N-acetylglucosamine transferase